MFTSLSFFVVLSKRRSDSFTCFSMAVIWSYPVALLITTLSQSTVFVMPRSLFSFTTPNWSDALALTRDHRHSLLDIRRGVLSDFVDLLLNHFYTLVRRFRRYPSIPLPAQTKTALQNR